VLGKYRSDPAGYVRTPLAPIKARTAKHSPIRLTSAQFNVETPKELMTTLSYFACVVAETDMFAFDQCIQNCYT